MSGEYDEYPVNEQNCNNGAVYLLLYEFERTMRTFIVYKAEEHLYEHYRDNWEVEFYKKISDSLLDEITSACKREKDIAIYTGMNIDYKKEDFLNFSFLSQAVDAWWDLIFNNYFKHQQYYKTDIDKIKNVRNAISHFRQTTTESQLDTVSICKRLLSIVYNNMPEDIYRSITNLDDIFKTNIISNQGMDTFDIKKLYLARSDVKGDLTDLILKAKRIEAIGISIDELTYNLGDRDYYRILKSGACVTLNFLDPDGTYVTLREVEEQVEPGLIANATRRNLKRMDRLRKDLEIDGLGERYSQIELNLYDEIPRVNMIFIDGSVVFVQYYANNVKGSSNPTMMIENTNSEGLFSFYQRLYNRILHDSAKQVAAT